MPGVQPVKRPTDSDALVPAMTPSSNRFADALAGVQRVTFFPRLGHKRRTIDVGRAYFKEASPKHSGLVLNPRTQSTCNGHAFHSY